MAVVVRPEDVDAFVAACNKENIDAVVVATVTEKPNLVMHWNSEILSLIHIFFSEIIPLFLLCLVKIILQSFFKRLLEKGDGYEIWKKTLSSPGGSDGLWRGFLGYGLWLLR